MNLTAFFGCVHSIYKCRLSDWFSKKMSGGSLEAGIRWHLCATWQHQKISWIPTIHSLQFTVSPYYPARPPAPCLLHLGASKSEEWGEGRQMNHVRIMYLDDSTCIYHYGLYNTKTKCHINVTHLPEVNKNKQRNSKQQFLFPIYQPDPTCLLFKMEVMFPKTNSKSHWK